MDIKPIALEGRAVRLEPLAEGHAESLAEAATPELFTYHYPPAEFSPAGFRALVESLNSAAGFCPFAIVERASGRAIGVTCYLDIRPDHRGLEIGFTWIGQPYQRSKRTQGKDGVHLLGASGDSGCPLDRFPKLLPHALLIPE